MACKDCAERRKKVRDAVLHGKMAEALDQTVEGMRKMIGFKTEEEKADEKAPFSLNGATTAEEVRDIVATADAGSKGSKAR